MSEHDVENAAGLNAKFNEAKATRRPFEPDWMLNRAFFSGNQWVSYQGGQVGRPVGLDPNIRYVTDNRLKGIILSRVARKGRNRPTFSATPQNGDDSAIASAKLGERILENDWEALRLHPKLFTALLWADLCSDGFIKVFWDSTMGEKVQALVGPDGTPLVGQDGGLATAEDVEWLSQANPEILTAAKLQEVAQGDLRNEVKSPFQIYPSPLATCMEDCDHMFEETVRTLDYVRQHFPVDIEGNELNPISDAGQPMGLSEGFYPNQSNLFEGSSTNGSGVKVREYHAQKCGRYPNGFRATVVNDRLVKIDDHPDDPMPYVKFASHEVPGRFWSAPPATDLRHPQVDLNVVRTQIKENIRRFGNPALMASRQADVEYSGRPGERIDYNSTIQDPKPEYLLPPPMQAYVENEVTRIEKSFEEISGLHEVSRATVPNGVTAASAINLLQEADETRLGPEIQSMEISLGEWGTKNLKLRATYNTDERLVMIAGKEGRWNPTQFKGEMLGPDPHVEVQAGSQMPRSKAAKQAAEFEILGMMLQYQYPVDERNLRRFLKSIEVGGLEVLFEGLTEDSKQVNREIRQMNAGQPLPINSFDNHEYHVADHTEYMKTDEFAQLPPEVQQIHFDHVAQHRQWMVGVVDLQANSASEAQQNEIDAQAAAEQETEIVKAEVAPTPTGGNSDGTT